MAVLNDFEACGYGVPALQPEDLFLLNDVPAREKVCGSGDLGSMTICADMLHMLCQCTTNFPCSSIS